MGLVGKDLSLILPQGGSNEFEGDGQGEAALVFVADADLGSNAGIAPVGLGLPGDPLQCGVEAGDMTGEEELLRVGTVT